MVKTGRNTFALMGIAALLITNSHLEKLYPKSFLAADGLLGNLIFFLLAGYGVAISQSQRPDDLGPFYLRRLRRIYPSLWPAVALAVVCGLPGLKWGGVGDWIWNLVWPTDYRFLAQILILYPVVWWMARVRARVALGVVWVLLALWLGIWVWHLNHPGTADLPLGKLPNYFWWTYFTLGTCLGAALARSGGMDLGKSGWVALIGVAGLYFGLKLELALRIWTRPETASTMLLGGALQMVALGMVVLTLFELESVNRGLERVGLKGAMEKIGKMSLQFYLLHQSLAWVLESKVWPWGWKVMGLYVGTYGMAWVLWKVTSWGRVEK